MWSKKPMPVSMSVVPVPSRSIDSSMSVSFVVRAIRAVRSLMCIPSYLLATISRNAARNSSFSSSVPTDTRRQFSSIGAWEKSRTRMPRS